jgi:hypothetical protein
MTKEYSNDQMTNARFTEEFGKKQYKKILDPHSPVSLWFGHSSFI